MQVKTISLDECTKIEVRDKKKGAVKMILFINACVRRESRTLRLAKVLLEKLESEDQKNEPEKETQRSEHEREPQKNGSEREEQKNRSEGENQKNNPDRETPKAGLIKEVRLEDIAFPIVNEEFITRRDAFKASGNYDDPMFDLGRDFAAADTIVIAAPYWDLSFPAALKQYFEQINVAGLTFTYSNRGIPEGLCRAKRLYYVTTGGGPVVPDDFGFEYVKALATTFYGIGEVRLIKAEGLDIMGADVEKILERVNIEP